MLKEDLGENYEPITYFTSSYFERKSRGKLRTNNSAVDKILPSFLVSNPVDGSLGLPFASLSTILSPILTPHESCSIYPQPTAFCDCS